MKSLTSKFTSSRGWALLLILFLGAGLLVSACGDEDVPAPTTPVAPPPPPPPPEPEPEPEPEPPATPTGLMVSATTENSITWTWNAVEGATAYAVQISTDEIFGDDDAIALALTATYTVSDLPPSTSVYLRVAAGVGTSLEDALLSGWSTHVTGMTAMPPPPPPPPEPPAVPSGLHVSDSGEDFIEWSWDAVEGADGYDVQFSPDEMFDSGDEIVPRAADQTSYRREPLPAGSDAFLRVRSRSGTGEDRLESDWSTHVTGMTAMPPPPPEPPAVPTGLQVSDSGEDFIEWTWDEVEGADGYEVQFSLDEMFDSGDEIIGRAADQTSYRREPLPAGSSAFLRVRSRSGTGDDRLESEWSTHATGMTTAPPPPPPEPPAVPAGLRVSASGEDFIEWSWDEVEGADGYEIQFSADEMFADSEIIGRAADQTAYRRQLPSGSTAYLRVRSHSGTGVERLESEWSTHVTGMTDQPMPPAVPANLRVSTRGEDYLKWSWDEVEGADGYEVQYSLDDERFTDQDPTAELAATDTSYRVSDLTADMDVYLRVRSFTGSGADRLASRWSTHATGMTEAPAPVAPATPSVSSVSGGDDYIEWRWDAVSGAEGFEVWYSADAQFDSADPMHDVGTELTYRQSGLDFDTFGYLRVRAYIGSGDARLSSDWTEEAIGRTNAAPPPPPAPAVPRINVPATGGEGLVTWSWAAVDGAGGYQIWYSANDAFTGTDPMEDLDNETLSYTKENLEAGTTHYLRVRSYIEVDGTRYYSEWTSQVSGQTDPLRPAVPTGLAVDAAATDHNSIGWTWTAVEGATSYEAQFSADETFTDADQIFTRRSTSHAVDRLQAETDGYLRVRAVMGTGASATRSDWSEASAGKTTAEPDPDPLSIPANLEISDEGRDSVSLTWESVDDADHYEVELRVAGGNWTDASCDGGDNTVEDTSCEAGGLQSGTDYEFRVRAVPDSGDDDPHAERLDDCRYDRPHPDSG